MEPVSGKAGLNWDGQGLTIDFPTPVTGVSPGQVVAIWYYNWCLGSGVIRDTITLDEMREGAEKGNILERMARAKAGEVEVKVGEVVAESEEVEEDELVEKDRIGFEEHAVGTEGRPTVVSAA